VVKLLRHDLHILSGAYALDALEGAERDRFEHHLHRCQPCAHEVGGLRETATRLATAAAVVPPQGLRVRVLAAVARTRQASPAVDQQQRPAPRSTWVPRLAAAVAAVGVAAAVVLGVAQLDARHRLDQTRAQSRAMAAVLAAPDARIMKQPTSAGGVATVVVSAGRHEMIFSTAGLPGLPAAKVYELWVMGPPGTRSAGLLAAEAGRTTPILASGLRSGDLVGLTVEPAGGTAQPTSKPILVMPLPA
jgi:anti-sigma-K factor RskA